MYTVRDVGFVDIGLTPYRLYYYIRVGAKQRKRASPLLDSNVAVEIVNVEEQKDHQAIEYLHSQNIKSFPAAVLVSPKGESLVLPISSSSKPFEEVTRATLESVVVSPKREEILQHIVEAYCVVLLIQGKEPAGNERAREIITSAIEEIAKMMGQMPKPTKEPPRLVVMPPESFSQERILLWSLGVNENEMDKPHAAVLYGRGRWIGPLLKGETITENILFNILSVIGSACECGLDRRLILGMMLPLRWGENLQSKAAELLGFDPENPMVKMEMGQILSMGMSAEDEKSTEPLADALYSYREETVEFESEPTVVMIPPVRSEQFREPDSTEPASPEVGSTFRVALFITGGMFFLILVVGGFIIFRARQKAD